MEPLAQKVRTNPNITGIQFGGDVHTISLYADDFLVTLTDPEVALGPFFRNCTPLVKPLVSELTSPSLLLLTYPSCLNW